MCAGQDLLRKCGHKVFHSHEERIVASCGVNAAVRQVPKYDSGFGSK
jgi:ribosomal protein L37E